MFQNNYLNQQTNGIKVENINNFFNENVKYINAKWKKMNDNLESIRADINQLEKMYNKYDYNQNFVEGAKYLRNKEAIILEEMNELFFKISNITNKD